MQSPLRALALVLATSATLAAAQLPAKPAPLTLAEAMRLAEAAHPTVLSREAQLASIEGARRQASSLFFNNPELSLERARITGDAPEARAEEWAAGVALPIEIAGQQVRRREAGHLPALAQWVVGRHS